jgi:hypothetical protein
LAIDFIAALDGLIITDMVFTQKWIV